MTPISSFANGSQSLPPNEYFTIPDVLERNVTVGERCAIAKIMPTDEEAENYTVALLFQDGTLVDTTDYSFIPRKAGNYKCVYSYFLGGEKYEYSYDISASVKDGPVFADTPNFPYAFVAGREYSLPMIDAADFSGGTEVPAKVEITVKNGEENVTVANGKFTVPESDNGYLLIGYEAIVGEKRSLVEYEVPVTKVYYQIPNNRKPGVDYSALFVSNGVFEQTAEEDGILFSAVSDFEVKYANRLLSDGFSLNFGFGDRANAESILIELTSYEDPNSAISIEFRKGVQAEGIGSVILNGNNEKAFKYSKDQTLRICLDETGKRLLGMDDELLFLIDKDLNGNVFTGLTGGFLKLKVSVKSVYGTTDLKINSVGLQSLNNSDSDLASPALFTGVFGMEYYVGDTVEIPAPISVDNVDPVSFVTLSIQLNGKYVKDLNGKDIENATGAVSFRVEKAGMYFMSYRVADCSGNVSTKKRVIYVYDTQKPALHIDGNVAEKIRINEEMKIPGFSAQDNSEDGELILQAMMITPSGRVDVVSRNYDKKGNCNGFSVESVAYTFHQKGKYILVFTAMDAYGNTDKYEFVIMCEE